ncbi:MAG TPA: PTS sugar transporter subunit IIB [Anaeromyxobacteraceae bacterium]|nr:PTS sugar transporter subunit IIB [Anaeromyxobacteraceae bacterium]
MISLVRVDNRLLHGQILECWVPRLKARRVVVADDDAAASPLAQAAMCLCLPPDIPAEVLPLASVDWPALAASPDPVLVLMRDVAGVTRAAASGLTPALAPRVNLGNVHYAAGRRAVTPSVFLTEGEMRAVEALVGQGFEVEARAVPSDTPTGPATLAEKWAAAAQTR